MARTDESRLIGHDIKEKVVYRFMVNDFFYNRVT